MINLYAIYDAFTGLEQPLYVVYNAHSMKVRKEAKIRNRYNQVPHLTQDTKWESNNHSI